MADGNSFVVERRRHIDAQPDPIRERLVDLRRWQAWSPWEDLDPQLQRNYGGAEAGVGAWYEWKGNRKAGEGRMEIVGADASDVTVDVQFLKPFKSHGTSAFHLDPDADGTLVTWTMTGPKTLGLKMMGIFTSMDKLIGPDFDKGLDRLKADVEATEGSGTTST